ncbi:interaptin [Musca domestica]|uniref:Interaptin n=1 Tax=Musca domestica TaxID=7370 RepID=A0ABM3UT02_MUSDO|nr:interaptin [Musca domestica]
MRLFLLSLLAVGSVHSLAIGYPYKSGLVGYVPARGEFPVQRSVVQGYVRYLDSHGVERLVPYSYPEPLYGVRQISYVGVPQHDRSREFQQIREAHFHVYSLQQYQALKREIDALQAEGSEPPTDLLDKFQPLEKIALTSDFSLIASLPDVKQVYDEHLKLFNDAHIKNLQAEVVHKPAGEIKTYGFHQAPLAVPVPVEESPEQKHAREEHLRIYNEQIKHWQELQEQHGRLVSEVAPKVHQTTVVEQSVKQVSSQDDGLTEVERATQEHLRLWNEAKLRAEKASQHDSVLEKSHQSVDKSHVVVDNAQSSGQEIHEVVGKSSLDHIAHIAVPQPKNTVVEVPQSVPHEQHFIVDTPEVVKARAEHLRLVEEAKTKVASVEHVDDKQEHHIQVPQVKSVVHDIHNIVHPVGIPDTPEVVKAREEHLRLVHEAQSKVHSVEQSGRTVDHHQVEHEVHPQIADTPEVVKAREEHLRLVNEAKLKAQSVEHHQIDSVHPEIVHPEETPEVSQAREQHLRIFNEVKAHVEKEQKSRSELGLEAAEQDRPKEEEKILELERIREAERLQEEQKQLELERMREAERLAEEQRQMEAELMRLKQEEEQRLALDLLEQQRQLKAEQEQLQQGFTTVEYKPISIPDSIAALMVEKQETLNNESPQVKSIVVDSHIQQPVQPQIVVPVVAPQYGENPFLKNLVVDSNVKQVVQVQQPVYVEPQVGSVAVPSAEPVARYIQSSQQSLGTKHQHIKDDTIKIPSVDHASYQPADTAAALIHLEKARQEHFRAHEQALEQLRLARVQNPSLKDCNH